VPTDHHRDWPSDRMAVATGLFARLTNAIDHGRFTEAAKVKTQLAELGFQISITPERTRRPVAGKVVRP
jgi:hypothetical protein